MLDIIIRNGTVVDGTGGPRFSASVGLKDGRIVALGEVLEESVRTIDAKGAIVAPGFVDLHTHYDAQVMWDPALAPSCLHGVTTVVAGNCGFTLAPIAENDIGAPRFIQELMARVEAIPVEVLQTLDWSWRSFDDFLSRLDGNVGLNVGFLAGHSALRRFVMGDDTNREASAEEVLEMKNLLAKCISEGALGLSSSQSVTHRGAPSLSATHSELIALAGILRNYSGTVLEFVPPMDYHIRDEVVDLLAQMSLAADRPLNWNLLSIRPNNEDQVQSRLLASDYARELGAAVFALFMPDVATLSFNFSTGFIIDTIPGWDELFALKPGERIAALGDPEWRHRLIEGQTQWNTPWSNFAGLTITAVKLDKHKHLEGLTLEAAADKAGSTVMEYMLSLAAEDELGVVFRTPPLGNDDDAWTRRGAMAEDPRIIVGGSDAGAHLDMLTTFGCYTTLMAEIVRDRGLLSLERAVQLATDRPARFYGLKDRGRIDIGAFADIVVFRLEELAINPTEFRNDLPTGAARLFSSASGIDHVIVNGTEVVDHGVVTGQKPGAVLRSGRDTYTVTAAMALSQS